MLWRKTTTYFSGQLFLFNKLHYFSVTFFIQLVPNCKCKAIEDRERLWIGLPTKVIEIFWDLSTSCLTASVGGNPDERFASRESPDIVRATFSDRQFAQSAVK